MADAKQFTCSCGWTLISPVGEDDVLKYAEMHANEYHADMNLGREQLKGSIRTVPMPQARSM